MVVNTKQDLARSYTCAVKGGSYSAHLAFLLVIPRQHMLWGIRNRNDARGFRIVKLIKHDNTTK